MRKGGNQPSWTFSQPTGFQSAQRSQSSLLELDLIHHIANKNWPSKKKLLDNP